jgi:secondary thiamine-phosphate synthase enzyme
MRTHRSEYTRSTAGAPDFVDITEDVQGALSTSGIRDGRVTVFSPQEACSLLVQERESGLLVDIEQTMQRVGALPTGGRTVLVGSSSVVLPAMEGRLALGLWQRVLLVELEEPRTRSVIIQITGE